MYVVHNSWVPFELERATLGARSIRRSCDSLSRSKACCGSHWPLYPGHTRSRASRCTTGSRSHTQPCVHWTSEVGSSMHALLQTIQDPSTPYSAPRRDSQEGEGSGLGTLDCLTTTAPGLIVWIVTDLDRYLSTSLGSVWSAGN